MQYFVFFATLILIPALFCFVDRRIKGCCSVLTKIANVIIVSSFVFLGVYFYGQQILTTFRINLKSFTNMKEFFNTRVLIFLLLLIFALFIAFKFVFVTVVFKNEQKQVYKEAKIFPITFLVFDLALIPNIFVNNALFGVFATLTLLEIGLVCIRLVFSNASLRNKEVIAL